MSTSTGRLERGPGATSVMAGLAAAWAALFGMLAVLALLDRAPHPWTPTTASLLAGAAPAQVSWVLVAITAAVLAALALAGARPGPRTARTTGWLLIGLGVLVAIGVSDVRALAFLGYGPMLILALIDVGPAAGHLEWTLVTDSAAALGHALGGIAVVVAGVQLLAVAGRLDGRGGPHWYRWARWGRPAVAVAVVVPVLYAATRVAWAIDIPLGIRRETLEEIGSARYAGLGLALFAIVGAWLTTGLVARWGEVFWTWVPRVGGHRVPVRLALVPGLVVAGAVTSAGLSFWRMLLAGELSEVPGVISDWAAWGPELLWPLWGVALAVACLAHLGRRTLPAERRDTSTASRSCDLISG